MVNSTKAPWLQRRGGTFPGQLLVGALVVLLGVLLLALFPAWDWLLMLSGLLAGWLLLLPYFYFRSFPHCLGPQLPPQWAYVCASVGRALLVGTASVYLAWLFVPLGVGVVVGMDVRLLLAR